MKSLQLLLINTIEGMRAKQRENSTAGFSGGRKPPKDTDSNFSLDDDYSDAYNKSKAVIAVDIASSKISVVIGVLDANQKIEILAQAITSSQGVVRGIIMNISKTCEALKGALLQATSNTAISDFRFILSVSGPVENYQQSVSCKKEKEAEITRKDIRQLEEQLTDILLPSGQIIAYKVPIQYSIDSVVFSDALGISGSYIEGNYHILTVRESVIKNLYRCSAICGFKIEALIPSTVASAEAVLHDEEKEFGVAAIDIGAATTGLTVFKHGKVIYSELLPLGGNAITSDIAQFACIVPKQAEKLKIQFGLVDGYSNPNDIVEVPVASKTRIVRIVDLAGVISARLEEIIGFAWNSVLKFLPPHGLKFGIVLTGGGALIPGITKLVEDLTGVACHIGLPDTYLSQRSIQNLKPTLDPRLATSIGLLKMTFQE